jgi:hypothetical protein
MERLEPVANETSPQDLAMPRLTSPAALEAARETIYGPEGVENPTKVSDLGEEAI